MCFISNVTEYQIMFVTQTDDPFHYYCQDQKIQICSFDGLTYFYWLEIKIHATMYKKRIS